MFIQVTHRRVPGQFHTLTHVLVFKIPHILEDKKTHCRKDILHSYLASFFLDSFSS